MSLHLFGGRVHQQVQSYAILFKKQTFGVRSPSFSLGLLLGLCCMSLILASLKASKSASLGMCFQMSLFAFSMPPSAMSSRCRRSIR